MRVLVAMSEMLWQGCARLMSRETLTQMSRARVESAEKIKEMS